MASTAPRQRRQLRNYLLDRKVQLRFTALMVLLSSLLTTGLGYYWYEEMRKASDVVRASAMATLNEGAVKYLDAELAAQDHKRLLLLVAFGVAFGLLIAAYGIVMTHKYAGPIYKIGRHLNDIEANRLYKIWDLRKGDQLQEFFNKFKAMHGALRSRAEADMLAINRLVMAIERGELPTDQLPRLKELLKEKGDSLRDASELTQEIARKDVS
ncbi:MAG: hypothetical protein JRH20_23645 [Deltaproteobacteria bacterium]|nr:hypothetical protein [Deltaproteobacteria bacterium]